MANKEGKKHHPPPHKPGFLVGLRQGNSFIINMLANMPHVLISKQKPQKIACFGQETALFATLKPVLRTPDRSSSSAGLLTGCAGG
ncbi:MAG: hypothetical protein WCE75_02405, partial [Terracidiphilus sp.]